MSRAGAGKFIWRAEFDFWRLAAEIHAPYSGRNQKVERGLLAGNVLSNQLQIRMSGGSIRNRLLLGGLAAVFFFGAGGTLFAAGAGMRTLRGDVPEAVARFHLQPISRLPATNRLNLAIGLPLHNQAQLDDLLRQLYDPASPNFHKFLTPEEFTARFGPTEADYAAVRDFASTNGMVVTGTYDDRLLLDMAGPAAAVESAFHVTLRTYHHPMENRDFFAPDTEPVVESNLPIADVSGLENYSRPHPKFHHEPKSVSPRAGSAPGSEYMGNDFRNAYVPGTTLDGSGQMVGLVQFDGYYVSDITAYESVAGRTNIPLTRVLIDHFSGTPTTGADSGNTEVSLDIEMAMSMAPALAGIIVFEGNPNDFIPNDVLNAMAASNMVKNLSCSWGWTGGPNTTTDNIFIMMAADGQSFFDASGDSDAFPPGYADNSGNTTVPSSSPYITQVGGTALTMNGSGASYSSEAVWNWGYDSSAGAYVGSSGGVSGYYSIPVWQQGVNSFLTNGGSMTMRNIPDVSLTADNVYVAYGNGSSGDFGGTSCAAPLWAGFMALVNQQAAAGGQTSGIGFINPAVYEIANESIYHAAFNDIITGDNTWPSSPDSFYAVPGYDLCTGIGTPAGTNLIYALVNPDALVVVSNGGFNAVISPFGTSNIGSQTFYLTNAGAFPLTWSLVNTSSWLNVSSDGGSLDGGAGGSVAVTLNAAITGSLTAGIYTASLGFSNVTSGVTHYRFFTLTVNDRLLILPTNNFVFFGPPGGPFSPASQGMILTNAGSAGLNWSINNTSSWFTVSQTGGALSSGAQTGVTISPAPAATNLVDGIYSAVLQVTNLTSQSVQPVAVSLIVSESLVQNGGFETGDFTDWTLNGDGYPDNFVTNSVSVNIGTRRHPNVLTIDPHSGSYFAVFGEISVQAYLSQSLPTAIGQKYLLSLWLDNPLAGSSGNPNEFSVSWNGSTLYDQQNIAAFGWSNMQFVVTSTGGSTLLQIGGRDDNIYLGLDDVTMTPIFPPTISAQPTNLTVLSGSNAVFSVAAGGTVSLAYQWRKNGTNIANGGNISGVTTSALTLASASTNNSGNYSVVITNNYGSITSAVATLTVVLPPLLNSPLTNQTIECGGNATFTIAPSGTPPLNIQWSLDGTPVPNATNASFALTNIHLPSHAVGVVVTNLYGSLTNSAVLAVQDTLAPVITLNGNDPLFVELGGAFTDPGATATDSCAGAVGVTVSGTVNTNSICTNILTYTADDGNGNTNTAARTVIVQDTTPPTILWSFTNLVMAADTNCSAPMPDVTGTNYILATDLSGALTISQTPTNSSILQFGTNAVVITVADASGNESYSTNTIAVQDETPPVITLNGNDPLFVELGGAFTDPGATAYDSCAGAVGGTVSGMVNTNFTGTNMLTYTADDGNGNTNIVTRTVIVQDTTPPAILWSFTNLVLAADTNCSAAIPDVTGTNYILATDLSGALTILQTPTNSSILPLGTNTVVITVADASGNESYSTNTIVVQDETPPVILVQPQSQTNIVGTTADFSVAVTACTPVSYQWLFNSAVLTNATNYTLTIGSVDPTNAGNYSVVAGASGGSVTSAVVTLTVDLIPPSINNVAIIPGGGFNLNFTGTPGYSYVLEVTTDLSSSANWLPVATNKLGADGVWQFSDTQAANYQHRFYRIRQLR
jgi:hypothetical protein